MSSDKSYELSLENFLKVRVQFPKNAEEQDYPLNPFGIRSFICLLVNEHNTPFNVVRIVVRPIPADSDLARREYQLLSNLRGSPYIPHILSYGSFSGRFATIELLPNAVSLPDLIDATKRYAQSSDYQSIVNRIGSRIPFIPFPIIFEILYHLSRAINTLHNRDVVVRLLPNTILITDTGYIRLAGLFASKIAISREEPDFDEHSILFEDMESHERIPDIIRGIQSSTWVFPPEVLENNTLTTRSVAYFRKHSDLWTLGRIAFWLLTGDESEPNVFIRKKTELLDHIDTMLKRFYDKPTSILNQFVESINDLCNVSEFSLREEGLKKLMESSYAAVREFSCSHPILQSAILYLLENGGKRFKGPLYYLNIENGNWHNDRNFVIIEGKKNVRFLYEQPFRRSSGRTIRIDITSKDTVRINHPPSFGNMTPQKPNPSGSRSSVQSRAPAESNSKGFLHTFLQWIKGSGK